MWFHWPNMPSFFMTTVFKLLYVMSYCHRPKLKSRHRLFSINTEFLNFVMKNLFNYFSCREFAPTVDPRLGLKYWWNKYLVTVELWQTELILNASSFNISKTCEWCFWSSYGLMRLSAWFCVSLRLLLRNMHESFILDKFGPIAHQSVFIAVSTVV